jgi:2-amino-4-hydroxy-6-hydroxymethyldihydropteridine diphosphokinase
MSLIIATGSNLGNSQDFLKQAVIKLNEHFDFIAASRIYRSKAVDYIDQPDFFNQVLEFRIPQISPEEAMRLLLRIESEIGRKRNVLRGPRTIDLDILFWGTEHIQAEIVTIPHPRWHERSFVVRPLHELPFFKSLEKCFTIPRSFDVDAIPV